MNNTRLSGARQGRRSRAVDWLGRLLLVLGTAGAAVTPGIAQEASSGEASVSGRILGHVVDGGTGAPVPQAQVSVLEGPSTLSDLNGRFMFSRVRAGTVEVTVRALGYAVKTLTGVEVSPDELVTLDVTLEQQALEVEGIRVSAARERGSTAYLLDERRSADAMVEAVGGQEIGRRPDSDAAEVARRMSGVTVSEGKYVFARGLGQRYSQTTLNGSPLPSPEPEREAVPLDLFPSGFLESLKTQKSYTADVAADFSGGSVQIRTKDFPSRFVGRFGVSTSLNTRSQFQSGFLRYQGGGMDWLGLDDGTRGQPAVVQELLGAVRSGDRLPTDPAQLMRIGEALRSGKQRFAPIAGEAPINRSFDLSLGGRADFGEESELGYFLAGTYTEPRSRKARGNAIAEYRGVPLELVRVELGEDVEKHDDFALYRRSRMIVRRTDTGAEGVLPLMDTLVRMRGVWKFMNFVDAVREVAVPRP